jgi:chaperone modulatory protein CbpM
MENAGFIEATHFCTVHNIELSFIHTLSEYGLIEIREDETSTWIPEQQVSPLEKYIRFYFDMDINIEGIHAVAHLLNKISHLEDELVQLRRKLAMYE